MPEYKPLPRQAQELCREVGAPPRLVAHLILVHDCAYGIVTEMKKQFPDLQLDEDAILFGAATHDVGKAIHEEELSAPGRKHEAEGRDVLKKIGIPDNLARFAWTHANWQNDDGLPLEDLFVALADNCWKGRRVSELEGRVVQNIAGRVSREGWEVFAALDDILQQVASDADDRLAWQASFPVAEAKS